MRAAVVIASWPAEAAGLAVAAAVALGYAAGLRALWSRGRGRGASPAQAGAFFVGVAAAGSALLPPVAEAAERALSAHMVQHVLLLSVAAPLVVVGRPGVALAAAAPRGLRRRVRRLGRGIAPLVRAATRPAVAWVLAAAVLLGWHVPGMYEAAVRSDVVHAIEHATLLGSAVTFWWVAVGPGRRRLAGGIDVLYVVAGGVPAAALGALLVFAAAPVYPLYATAAGPLDPLRDQQLAGATMWVPAGFVSLVVAAALFVRWLRQVERDQRRAEERHERSRTVAVPARGGRS